MKQLSDIPETDREHYLRCPLCEDYFDMRDLGAVVEHEHWPTPVAASFSHSVKRGNAGEVYVRGSRGMVTLRQEKKQAQNDLRQS